MSRGTQNRGGAIGVAGNYFSERENAMATAGAWVAGLAGCSRGADDRVTSGLEDSMPNFDGLERGRLEAAFAADPELAEGVAGMLAGLPADIQERFLWHLAVRLGEAPLGGGAFVLALKDILYERLAEDWPDAYQDASDHGSECRRTPSSARDAPVELHATAAVHRSCVLDGAVPPLLLQRSSRRLRRPVPELP
jgi:hypothetical protein